MSDLEEIVDMERKSAAAKQQVQLAPTSFSKASSNFDIKYLGCNWSINPTLRYIQGSVKTGFNITERANTITLDLADELKVDSILYRNTKLVFYRPFDNTVIISFGGFLEKNTYDYVEIFYKGIPPVSTPIVSFVASTHSGSPVLWTLSEPYGGRDWWPCKNGLNDKADTLDVTLTTPQAYKSTTNGMMVNEVVSGGNRIRYFQHRYPIATYLVAFAVSNYSEIYNYVDLDGVSMPIIDYAYPEKQLDFINAVPITQKAMQLLHSTFVPYPFINEKYGHTQFGFGGGMEHQTNSFMYNMGETLIVHEMAHQWFGDRITCGSWKDTWLNEGFALYCTNMYTEKNYPEANLLTLYRQQLNLITSKANGSVYVDDTTSVYRIFDSRLTYTKGAWVLQMLRWKLGDALFYSGVKNYLNDPLVQYNYAKTTDLKRHFENISGKNLTEFFNDWVYGQGHPTYQLQWATAGNKWVQLTLNQTTSDTSVKFFEMPVPIRLKNKIYDTTLIIDHIKNNQISFHELGFIPDSVFIDPKMKLISGANTVTQVKIFADKSNVVVFPNPIGSSFNVLLRDMTEGILHLSLYNSSGQLIWRRRVGNFNGSDLIEVPSGHLPAGNYWLRVNKDEDPMIVRRVMK